MAIAEIIDVVNLVAVVAFVVLLFAVVARMVLRLRSYRREGRQASVILRRDFGLLTALLVIFGSGILIRAFDVRVFLEDGLPRLVYVSVIDAFGIIALAYWTWVEYFRIGRVGYEND